MALLGPSLRIQDILSRSHSLNPLSLDRSSACIIRLNTIVSHFELGRSRVTEKFKISVNSSGRLRCLVVLMVMKFSQHILIGEYGTKKPATLAVGVAQLCF